MGDDGLLLVDAVLCMSINVAYIPTNFQQQTTHPKIPFANLSENLGNCNWYYR